MNPAGKIAVVSGGSSGLGEACAAALAEAGAKAISFDLKSPTDSRIAYQPCDITDAAATEAAIAAVMAEHGAIHICLNCAGIGGLGAIATPEGPQSLEDFKRVIDVNLIGAVNLTRLAAHRMIGNAPDGEEGERGIIVNAASIASFQGQQGMGAYTASKSALAALTLVWARDLSKYNIRAMSIAAGFFATPMTAGLPEPIVDELLETMEFPKRAGRPDEFAKLALFIIQTPLMNGDVIRLDGGTRPPARTRWTGA